MPTGARITAVARVDGANVGSAPCALDAKGRCTVSLKLPAAIERGEGTLAFTIEDGGGIETVTRTIPLLVTSFHRALPERSCPSGRGLQWRRGELTLASEGSKHAMG